MLARNTKHIDAPQDVVAEYIARHAKLFGNIYEKIENMNKNAIPFIKRGCHKTDNVFILMCVIFPIRVVFCGSFCKQ